MLSLSLLCKKDIISIITGENIGRLDDLEFDLESCKIVNLIVFGRPKFFGLFGREDDLKIPLKEVVSIGKDVIIINSENISLHENTRKIKLEFN